MIKTHEHEFHKYKKVTFPSGHVIFKCMFPNCKHFIAKELLPGRIAICWRCDEPFIITTRALVMSKPHCNDEGCKRKYTKRREIMGEVI